LKENARRLLFTNCTVWTGDVGSAAAREVLVEGSRIASVAPVVAADRKQDAVVVDCGGATLMPGLVDGHSHLSFLEKADVVDTGYVPVEEHTLQTMHNARRVLLGGFTSCVGASSAKPRLDIVIRNEIKAGRIPGPRLLASTPEITVTGGLGDERLLHMYRESFAVVIDGPEDIRRYVRTMSREGCDIIKLNISGNQTVPNAPPTATIMTEAEIEAAVTTAHAYGKRGDVARAFIRVRPAFAQAWASNSSTTASSPMTTLINMLEEHRERVFLAPAFGLLHNTLYEAAPWGITPEKAAAWGLPEQVENCANVYRELRKRGLRVADRRRLRLCLDSTWTNARDLDHFVKWFGYTPEEALVCGTINRAKARRMDNEIGRVRDGYLADLIIVRGRPHEDVSCLSTENILVVLKEGEPHGDFAWRISCATPAEPVALI